MTKIFCLCLLGLLVVDYAQGEGLLQRLTRGARQRKQEGLKNIPGCEWTKTDCTPKKGRCGKGFQTATLTGPACPSKTKRVRCRIPCREEARGPIPGLSPSEAGLRGEAVNSRVSNFQKKTKRKGKLCRYEKGEWTPCDTSTNQIKRTLTLKKGDPATCPQTKEIMKKCRKACKYTKSPWTSCDPAIGKKSRTLTLKKGDPNQCEAKKIVNRKCRSGRRGKKTNKVGKAKGCKYSRGDWSECDVSTNKRTRTLTLRKGDTSRCKPTITVMRKCKKPCKYTRGDWSVCNPVTSVRSRTLTLRKGDPNVCERTKIIKRKCKKPCRYTRGQWSECDPVQSLKFRVDTLKEGNSEAICEETRRVTKPCKVKDKQKCKYDIKPWGECDPATSERSREKTLLQGGPHCRPTVTITRSCQKNNGEERCFFGPWGEFEDCLNGVKKKMRAVISGPPSCERKAVKTKPCKSRKSN